MYRERDYTCGVAMFTLRTKIGLTQAGLANHLGISRRAVGEWEAGSSYPRAEHLKQVIALAVKQQAFPAGHEVEKIRVLWKVTHQRVLLDERWLSTLLDEPEPAAPHPLKVERERRGWSQAKVAEDLNTTTRTVSRWEQGQALPYPFYREQLCALFGKDARELGLLPEREGASSGELVVTSVDNAVISNQMTEWYRFVESHMKEQIT